METALSTISVVLEALSFVVDVLDLLASREARRFLIVLFAALFTLWAAILVTG